MAETTAVPDVGTLMPDFSLINPSGVRTNLHAVRAKATTVVYFLRASTCPACLKHARALAELAEADELGGAEVVLVAPGDVDEARRLADRVASSAVSAWASGTAHGTVGMGSFLAVQHSGTFLVSDDGTIRYRRTATLPTRSFDRDELLGALARVR
ncbi:peroxiredoxin [Saccharothrix coeruleofusca]|uniref:peroxiredoxin family protein n=1 Tax=Saccharothrix coeruleofusca TaxID=33919 RepID=UPI001AE30EBA|nr:redoxin domain-containing protein [Saccharothrix coeruleofusca]MBP2337285.1 peroxiredoxin [Saccharothrix coeruleofusca]